MNCLIVCPWDNGQQGINLCNALNKYTEHEARCITIQQSYLDFDTDILWPEWNTTKRKLELRSLLADTDFFIFSELMPYDTQAKQVLEKIGLFRKVNPKNTIIRIAGSIARMQGDKYLLSWIRKGWMFAGPIYDWTLFEQIGRIAPVDYICPIGKIPDVKVEKDKIRVCFAPTKKEKGVDEFTNVMREITKKYDNVEGVPITGKTWKQAIEIKARCNITFDQFMIPSYANNAIEGMWLKHVVLSKLIPWVFMIRSDLPIVSVNNGTDLYNRLEYYIEHKELIDDIGEKGRQFVEKWHTPEKAVKTWERLIEHVRKI